MPSEKGGKSSWEVDGRRGAWKLRGMEPNATGIDSKSPNAEEKPLSYY